MQVEIDFARDSDNEYILRSSVVKREREREMGQKERERKWNLPL